MPVVFFGDEQVACHLAIPTIYCYPTIYFNDLFSPEDIFWFSVQVLNKSHVISLVVERNVAQIKMLGNTYDLFFTHDVF